MCAQYIVAARKKQWKLVYGIDLPDDFEGFDEKVVPYKMAPVVLQRGPKRVTEAMNFSLIPAWSKESKVKFSTHNARLESTDEKTKKTTWIFEKPTWRTAFAKRHCLIPISSFVEPAYHGKMEGNMVAFHDKNDELITAAAIWEAWTDQKTGEVIESFSIITDDPIPYVYKSIKHDRSPLFLKPAAFEEWLDTEGSKKEPKDWVKFLRKNTAELDLEASVDRPMAKGWEKRR